MSDPIVFIVRNQVKSEKYHDFIRHYQNSIARTIANKPGTLVQLAYASEDHSEVIIFRVFPSAEALDEQLRGADERSKEAYRLIEPTSVEIYGTPNPYAMEMIEKVAGSGIAVRVNPGFVGGFMCP